MTRHTHKTHQGDSCTRAEYEAMLYAAGELPETDIPAFENHLKECSACRSVIAEYHAAVRLTAATPAGGPPLATLDQLASAARKHVARRTGPERSPAWLERVREWLIGLRPAPALGWALAVLVLLFGIGQISLDSGNIVMNGNGTAILAWEHDVLETEMVAAQTADNDILPRYLSSDATEDAIAYDLVAIADELDALANRLQEF